MARISEAEKKLTPIYFQTRRETKWSVPPVALPTDRVTPNPYLSDRARKVLEEFEDGLISREEAERLWK